jgi:hypothetical protein
VIPRPAAYSGSAKGPSAREEISESLGMNVMLADNSINAYHRLIAVE